MAARRMTVTSRSVELLEVAAAGLMLADQRGQLRVVAFSAESARLGEVVELQNSEGPCLDCVRNGTAVSTADLAADHDRWPLFVPEALAAGFRSVTAVPLRLREQTIGGLNMFSDTATMLRQEDRELAQALAAALPLRRTVPPARGSTVHDETRAWAARSASSGDPSRTENRERPRRNRTGAAPTTRPRFQFRVE